MCAMFRTTWRRWSTRRGSWGRGWRPPPPHTGTSRVSTLRRECWMIYRGPGFLVLSCQENWERETTCCREKGVGSRIIRPQEGLALSKSFNTLWPGVFSFSVSRQFLRIALSQTIYCSTITTILSQVTVSGKILLHYVIVSSCQKLNMRS